MTDPEHGSEQDITLNMTEGTTLRESPVQTYIEWTIENFSDLSTEDDYFLTSPSFLLSDTEWNFWIYPNGETRDGTVGWIGLYLMGTKLEKEYKVQYTIGLKKADGSVLVSVSLNKIFNKKEIGFGTPGLFKRSVLLSSEDIVDPDGSLTVFCMAKVGDQEIENQIRRDGIATLSDNFKDLYISRRFTDVTIIVQGREFLAHRIVLMSRSTVFASMLDVRIGEKRNCKIEISDCDPDSFEDFLLFVYTGKLDMVSPINAMSLYETADKFDMKELKEECVLCMTSGLSVDWICDVLLLAASNEESDLFSAAVSFYIANTEAIIRTTKWETFLADNVLLGNELFLKVLESKKRRVMSE